MLYPITLLLWTLFFAEPSNPGCTLYAPIATSNQQSCAATSSADSAIYLALKQQLEQYQQQSPQEKVYLQFDRSFLKPGETLWFNAYLLNAGDLQPSWQSQVLHVELLDARGAQMQVKKILVVNGMAAGEFDFPATLPGGLYKIRAYTNWMRNFDAAFERDITLQKVVLPRVNLKLEFERKGLGAGEEALARFDAYSLDNKALANKTLQFTAAVGGQQFQAGTAKTDDKGRAYIRFALPESIATADGLLNVQVEHNGVTESISRPIPIVLNKIDLQFFPEGGDAVVGIPCHMAFKAVNEFGKAADVEGGIFDQQGAQVASFSSFHNGMGAFDFTPKAGMQYEARLNKPFSDGKPIPLSGIQTEGFGLHLQERDAENLVFAVSGNKAGKVILIGQSRDKLFFHKTLDLKASEVGLVTIPTKNLPIGIARFTLFDQNKTELAERLAFVNRDHSLKITLKTDKEKYLPREKVNLKIHVADHQGKPVQGRFSLAVADDNLLTFADDKQGHLLSSLLLEQDVKGEIEEPNFYFDETEPKSEQALDYLLLTQGWRRFVWEDVLKSTGPAITYQPEQTTISGTILLNNGAPANKGKVSLYPDGPTVLADENGRFVFKDVDLSLYTHLQTPYNEYFELSTYNGQILRRANGSLQSVMALPSKPSMDGSTCITGLVEDENEVLPGATISAVSTKGASFYTSANIDGVFRMNLEPGFYDLSVSYTGYQAQRFSSVEVKFGKTHYLEANLENNAMILSETVVVAKPMPSNARKRKAEPTKAVRVENKAVVPVMEINEDVAFAENVDDMPMPALDMDANEANADGLMEEVIVVADAPIVRADDFATGQVLSKDQIVQRSKPGAGFADKSKKRMEQPRPGSTFSKARVFYVPPYGKQQSGATRSDFRSTIYWNPGIETSKQGDATVSFYSSDAITNFRATLEGLGGAGIPGRCEQKFYVQKPVSITLKTPPSVITGDVMNLQVSISNNTTYPSGGYLKIKVPAHFSALTNQFPKGQGYVSVPAGQTKQLSLPYRIGLKTTEDQEISVKLSADESTVDASEANIRTLNAGYPVKQVVGGYGAHTSVKINLIDPVDSTVAVTLNAYPSTMQDVLQGMERMLQQPGGCFEQVSSSNYPNLLVLDLLRQTGDQRPEVESKAKNLLEDGYKQLTAYECPSGGFDWWGRDPAHEGLTAYGILEFTDMSKVFKVDKKMIDRTVNWLKSRRDGQGGWTLNPNSLHGWQNDPVLDCYIVWALAEAGYGKEFSAEIKHARVQAEQSNDPYQMALLANALLAMGDPAGQKLSEQLLKKQDANGSWVGNTHSVMYAYGDCFRIETTALSALALMKSGKKSGPMEKAMEFLFKSKTDYGYGSTQSTVLALKAIIGYVKLDKSNQMDGSFSVLVDGKKTGDYKFSNKSTEKLQIKGLERYFTNNNPQIEIVFADKNVFIPIDVDVRYASRRPQNAPTCPLALSTSLDQKTASVGSTVRMTAKLTNPSAQAQASPMVVLGIPSGLTLQPWQLKKLVEEKQCDFYELWDGFAVFHFENLAGGATRELNLDLRADIPGTYEAPASQAFLYYSNDQRVWSKPEKLEIR